MPDTDAPSARDPSESSPSAPADRRRRRHARAWLPWWLRPALWPPWLRPRRLWLLPVDLIVLSVDFLRAVAWYVTVRLLALSDSPAPAAKRPFLPCDQRASIAVDGQNRRACQPGQKYANPFVLGLLCSGVQTTLSSERCVCVLCRRHGNLSASGLRLFGAAIVLGVIWGLALVGGLSVRSRLRPSPVVARQEIPPAPPAPLTPATTAVESAAAADVVRQPDEDREPAAEPASEALVLLSGSALAMGRREEARAAAEKALLLAPDDPRSQVQMAEVELAEGHLEVAAEAFRKILAARPTYAEAGSGLARVLLAQGDVKAALAQAQAVLQATPDNVDAAVVLAEVTLASGDRVAATECFGKLNREHPGEIGPGARYVDLLLRARKGNEALTVARRLVSERPRQADAQLVLGDAYLRLKLADQAMECCQNALRSHPQAAMPHLLLARIYMAKGNHADAAVEIEGLLKAVPNDIGLTLALATCREATGQGDDAVTLCQAAAAAHPETAAPWLRLARLQSQAGRGADALASARQAVARHADDAQALNALASLLVEQDGSLVEAIALASRAHELAPGRAPIMDTLGWAYHLQQDETRALELLGRARGAMPRHALIRYHYAAVLAAVGRTQEAARELAPALKLPGFRHAEAAQKLNVELQARLATAPSPPAANE